MGAKATFDSVTRIVKLTEAPSLIDGELVVELDVKVDLYGDQKEDWLANPTTLRKVRPPFSVIGGQTTPTGFAGNTFFQRSDWKIEPYDANHILRISGNLNSNDGKSPFIVPSGGTYMVQIERVVSNIVDTVVTGSGVLPSDVTDIRDAIWAKALEGSMSAEGMMRIMMSALSAASRNHEMGLPDYMSMDGSKPRISAETDEFGNRTSRVLDET